MFKYNLDYINLIHLAKVSVNSKKLKITYYWDNKIDAKTFANQSDFDDAVQELEDAGLLLIGETWFNKDRLSIVAPNSKTIRFNFVGNVTVTHEYADISEVQDVIDSISDGFLEFNGKWYQGKQLHVVKTNPSTLEVSYDFLGMDLFKVKYDSQADFDDAIDKVAAIAEGGGTTTKRVKTPVITPAGGEVAYGTSCTITCATEGATIHYTIDGSTPTASSPTYSSPITINATMTVKAIAVKAEMKDSGVASTSYIITVPQVATPTMSPNGGAVDKGTTVTITCATDGADIYYTTDGSTPSASSTKYTTPITVNEGMTINAIGIKAEWLDSSVVTKNFKIKLYKYAGVYNNASPSSADDHLPAQSDLTLEFLENLTDVTKLAATNKAYGGPGDEKLFTGISEDNSGRLAYCYPASLGNLTSYISNGSTQAIGNSFTLMTATIDGVEYNCYFLTDSIASPEIHMAFV